MIQFLTSYWKEVLEVVCLIISLVLWLLKKTKIVKQDTILEQLVLRLPVMIRQAEKTDGNGAEKKASVMLYALSWLADMTGESMQEISKKYEAKIDVLIEDILTTPTKKGVE